MENERKTLFLASMILLLLTVPAFAAYKVEPLPDGTYEVTFTYQTNAEDVFLIGEFNNWVENDEALRMTKMQKASMKSPLPWPRVPMSISFCRRPVLY